MGVAEKTQEIAPSPGTCAFNKVLLSKRTILQTKELLNIPIIKYRFLLTSFSDTTEQDQDTVLLQTDMIRLSNEKNVFKCDF